jgi:tetratricopeptide (TPR) repeat protein
MSRAPRAPSSPQQPRDLLEQADRLRQQGQLDRAEAICFPLTRRHPGYVAALHTLGLIYLDKRSHERALDCLVRAQMLDPDNWMTLTALSLAYLRLGAGEMAARTLDQALTIRPNDASILTSLGEIHRDEREYELAEQAYRRAVALDPALESASTGLALSLQALGQPAEAAAVLKQAFARGLRSLNLLHIMTTLPQQLVNIDLLGALDREAENQRAPDAEFKSVYAFARASALHSAGRHAEAWQFLTAANRPLAAASKPALEADEARRAHALAALRNAPPTIAPSDQRVPVSLFILGPSRSGKTSLERLIAGLDGVKAGCESPLVDKAVIRAFQAAASPVTGPLSGLPPALLPSFRDHYAELLARRAGPARVFTGTRPGRILDADILAATVPNVRLLLVRRDRDDTALRIYMTKYLRGNAYAYDLRSIRAYLDWYDEMTEIVIARWPQIARLVTYDEIVAEPGAVLRAAAELCGIGLGAAAVSGASGHDRGCAAPYRAFIAQG